MFPRLPENLKYEFLKKNFFDFIDFSKKYTNLVVR